MNQWLHGIQALETLWGLRAIYFRVWSCIECSCARCAEWRPSTALSCARLRELHGYWGYFQNDSPSNTMRAGLGPWSVITFAILDGFIGTKVSHLWKCGSINVGGIIKSLIMTYSCHFSLWCTMSWLAVEHPLLKNGVQMCSNYLLFPLANLWLLVMNLHKDKPLLRYMYHS